MLITAILITYLLTAIWEAELIALIKRWDRVGQAVAARLHNGEFGSPATAKRHWSTARGVATTCWAFTENPAGISPRAKGNMTRCLWGTTWGSEGSAARKSPHKAFLLSEHQVARDLTCEFWDLHRGDACDVKKCRLLHGRWLALLKLGSSLLDGTVSYPRRLASSRECVSASHKRDSRG